MKKNTFQIGLIFESGPEIRVSGIGSEEDCDDLIEDIGRAAQAESKMWYPDGESEIAVLCGAPLEGVFLGGFRAVRGPESSLEKSTRFHDALKK